MKKVSYIIVILLVLVMTYFVVNKEKVYSRSIFAMDTYINVKIYSNKNSESVLDEIEKMYLDYHRLTDRFNHYDGFVNVFDINGSNGKVDYIDNRLLEILKYGASWYQLSDGLYDINMGALTEVWKKYIAAKNGIPTKEELETVYKTNNGLNISDNHIVNDDVNIDLGAIAKGFATKKVGEYLEEKGFKKYIVNAGGHVLVGKKYQKEGYKIGIENPLKNSELLTVVKGENIVVSTSGDYERFYEYEGKIYHHIINPNTLMPANYMRSVSVVTKDSALADVLTTLLFLMPIDEGKEFLAYYEAEAIWVDNSGNITKSNGFTKYE